VGNFIELERNVATTNTKTCKPLFVLLFPVTTAFTKLKAELFRELSVRECLCIRADVRGYFLACADQKIFIDDEPF
jgi:hypothetical protein